MVVLTPVMRLRYWIDPSARKKDIDAMTKSGKFEITEDNRKYWMASDPNNLDEFMWTWKQISTMIKTEFQNLNKVMINPILVYYLLKDLFWPLNFTNFPLQM